MIKKILLGLAALIAVVLVVAAFQADDFSVQRSAKISAPAAVVFGQVNDLKKWQAWSPWEKLDPAMKRTFEGPQAGTGAAYAWAGNSKVGEGRMTITESRPSELIRLRLDFIKPFASTSDVEFSFKPEGGQTAVTWTMSGKKNYMSKLMCMFMSMDKMVGGDFETGLANLKSVSENPAKT